MFYLGIFLFGSGTGTGLGKLLNLGVEPWVTFDLALYLLLVGIGIMIINQKNR